MKAGDEFEYKGIKYKVESEKSEYSCDGCELRVVLSRNQIGCKASSQDKVFDSCMHDRVIFVKVSKE